MARWRLVLIVPCWGRSSAPWEVSGHPQPTHRCPRHRPYVVMARNVSRRPLAAASSWLRTTALSQWAPGTLLPPRRPSWGSQPFSALGHWGSPSSTSAGLSHHRGDVRSRALQVQGAGARRPLLGWGGIRARGRSLFGEGRLGAQACFQPCHCCF